ncbi:MAG: DUF4351 domain-containing protein [Merismopedia sp. SIO2A8]|nr:DUF4351 domain-containing protein [Symploca sp. SIO2B6]NET47468.1 DUF4351 domain-containing protein [Merismopedia sp. SIO2A8]
MVDNPNEFDSPWKEAIKDYFEDFMAPLEALGEILLDFTTLDDLTAWLTTHTNEQSEGSP